MKLLRNPIAVGVLAVIAVVYCLWTVFGARGFRSSLATAATPAANGPAAPVPLSLPAAAPALPASPASPVGPSPSLPDRPIDLPAITALVTRWIESPLRDPFQINRPHVDTPTGPPASQMLALRAIWRQTGSQLAIINGQILREGERLLGFAIETIEAEGVWVRGTNGRERITFPSSIAAPAIEAVTTALDGPPPTQETITAHLPVATPP